MGDLSRAGDLPDDQVRTDLHRHVNATLGNAIAVPSIVMIAASVSLYAEAPLRNLMRRMLLPAPSETVMAADSAAVPLP
jgi:hypothetical protein